MSPHLCLFVGWLVGRLNFNLQHDPEKKRNEYPAWIDLSTRIPEAADVDCVLEVELCHGGR